MSNYCAQLPPHTQLNIHGRPQIQKSPYGYTQGPKFIFFQNARIQTIFEGVKKTYFKFNQGEEKQTATGTDAPEISSQPRALFPVSWRLFFFTKKRFVLEIFQRLFISVITIISVIKQCH